MGCCCCKRRCCCDCDCDCDDCCDDCCETCCDPCCVRPQQPCYMTSGYGAMASGYSGYNRACCTVPKQYYCVPVY